MKKMLWALMAFSILFFGCTTTPNNPDQNANLPVFTQNHLQAVVISTNNCSNCFSVSGILRTLNVPGKYVLDSNRVVDFNSVEGKQLIKDYNIKTLPAVIVSGEIKSDLEQAWTNPGLGTIDNNKLVLRTKQYPYFDVKENRIKGEVKVVVVEDQNCTKCRKLLSDANQDANGFVQFNQRMTIAIDTGVDENIFVSTIQFVSRNSEKGKELIQQWRIKRFPTLALSAEARDYNYLGKFSGDAGFVISEDGWLVNQNNAPFIDANTNELHGIVNVTVLTDENCTSCFNAGNAFKQFFETYSVTVGTTPFVDISTAEGKALVKKFEIRAVPTVITNSDLRYYPGLFSEWLPNWGTITPDGNFVFRNVSGLAGSAIDANTYYRVIDLNQFN